MNLRRLTFYLAVISFFSACKKDDFDSGTRQRLVKIELNNQYMVAENIDSAFLYSTFIGPATKFNMQVRGNSLETRINAFSQSTGKLMLQVYTTKKFEGKSLQFEKEMDVNLSETTPLVINGPSAVTDLSWKPRVILDYQSETKRYTAVVALRITDPYFEIQHLPQGWNNRISVTRAFYQDNYANKVYGFTWNCNTICGNQMDRTSFINLHQKLNGIVYNKIAIEVAFYTSPTTIDELSFEYNK